MQPRIFVCLGFHMNFYHSYRGDTPDEAGFGQDIRVVRRILEILNQANASGMQAHGYWDTEVYWTFENILPAHAPDIITGLQARVESGQDEIVVGPYNNGANHAATQEEFQAAIHLALENRRGSGLKQLFSRVAPYYRAQESMHTVGQNRILLEAGIEGVLHYYAGVPFNALSTFVPVLPIEQQHNPLWMRCAGDEPKIILWPMVSIADVLNHISLEMWMLELRRLQRRGQIGSDLLLHINFDADVDSWLPFDFPRLLSWFPNSGGLVEYIHAVNKYPWAEFTTLSEYIRTHPPGEEVLVRQDLADGAYDGNTSWAEKYSSLQLWSILEQSRLHTYRAQALAQRVAPEIKESVQRQLWQGMDSSFFQRMVGLSTTHFGLSTPMINEQRQARAEAILSSARDAALQAEREAAEKVLAEQRPSEEAAWIFQVHNYGRGKHGSPDPARMLLRVPIILPQGVKDVRVKRDTGEPVHASLVNVQLLPGGERAGEIAFVARFGAETRKVYQVHWRTARPRHDIPGKLQNPWFDIAFAADGKLASFQFDGEEYGHDGLLNPFITYGVEGQARTSYADRWDPIPLEDEHWDGMTRIRRQAKVPVETDLGTINSHFNYTFTLHEDLPYVFVDVDAYYGYTLPQDLLENVQQKLGRLLDRNWIEVAPFHITPQITAPAGAPLRVWKHNYLGITSWYELNYGSINSKNKNLDAFNHQVTAGWVAISNRERGLLVGESAAQMTSMAFCPMRLRQDAGRQLVALNPFGSFHGQQLNYGHLPGTGLGVEITQAVSNALNPSAPSFNGQRLRFSLMLAPYHGDAPPAAVQHDAAAHFYPFGVLYHKATPGIEAALPEQLEALIKTRLSSYGDDDQGPIAIPQALLANPSDQAVTLVWDPVVDPRLAGYEVRWRKREETLWQYQVLGKCKRWSLGQLSNGVGYVFQLRARAGEQVSDWSERVACVPGALEVVPLGQAASGIPLATMVRMLLHGLYHGAVTRLLPRKR